MSQTFGASLREARERKGLSLRQIATATKISVATLESLERGEFSKLPGGIFSRSFVRSYAIEVGLDPDETVQRFLDYFETDEAAAAAAHDPAAGHLHAHAPAGTHAADEVGGEFEFESRQRIARAALILITASLPVAGAILYLSSRTPAPPPREAAVARVQPAAPDTEPIEPAARSVTPASAPEPPAPAVASVREGVTIEVAPAADCWIRLSVDGGAAVSKLLKAGERERAMFHDNAVLQVGDAAVCTVLIDGRATRPLGAAGKVREIRLTRENYATFLP
jgi:cytoskeletal protein RodZ